MFYYLISSKFSPDIISNAHVVADVGLGKDKRVDGIITKVLEGTNQCEIVTMPLDSQHHDEMLKVWYYQKLFNFSKLFSKFGFRLIDFVSYAIFMPSNWTFSFEFEIFYFVFPTFVSIAICNSFIPPSLCRASLFTLSPPTRPPGHPLSLFPL